MRLDAASVLLISGCITRRGDAGRAVPRPCLPRSALVNHEEDQAIRESAVKNGWAVAERASQIRVSVVGGPRGRQRRQSGQANERRRPQAGSAR